MNMLAVTTDKAFAIIALGDGFGDRASALIAIIHALSIGCQSKPHNGDACFD